MGKGTCRSRGGWRKPPRRVSASSGGQTFLARFAWLKTLTGGRRIVGRGNGNGGVRMVKGIGRMGEGCRGCGEDLRRGSRLSRRLSRQGDAVN